MNDSVPTICKCRGCGLVCACWGGLCVTCKPAEVVERPTAAPAVGCPTRIRLERERAA